MNKLDKANLIVALLKSDPLVKSETVRIERWSNEHDADGMQVEFYTKHDPEEDSDAGPTHETEDAITKLGGVQVAMNDCEGCYGEGCIWFD